MIIGTGSALAKAGPASILIAYSMIGFLVYVVMCSLGEMATWLPSAGGFSTYAARFCDPALGFATGYTYWFKYIIITPNQLTAAALVIQYWLPASKVNPGVWIAIFLVIIVCINYFGVRFFGEFEFYLSSAKVIIILGLLILMICITAGGVPGHDAVGFEYWNSPGAFKEYKATGTAAAHAVSPTGDALLKSSNATNATAGHDSVSSGIVPSGAGKVLATSAASNTSTKVHLEGQIGTLLSAAMFPAAMRAPTTSLSQASAPTTTLAPSIPEHSIVPIPMSQKPNTTAPNGDFQAFVHTINTETLAASQRSSSSHSTLPTSASHTPGLEWSHKSAASSSETLQHATEPSATPSAETGKPKTGEKLHHYLHSVALKKPSTTLAQEVPTASSESSSLVTPVASVHGNDTQAITRINTHTTVTLTQEQPAATPHAYTSAHHHHPRARRFIG